MFKNRAVKDGVECIDLALNTASVADVNKRILRGIKDVASDDDVSTPEVDDAVAIGGGLRHVKHFDAVAIVELPTALREVGVNGPRIRRGRLILAERACHSCGDVFVSDDGGRGAHARRVQGQEGSDDTG